MCKIIDITDFTFSLVMPQSSSSLKSPWFAGEILLCLNEKQNTDQITDKLHWNTQDNTHSWNNTKAMDPLPNEGKKLNYGRKIWFFVRKG